MILEKDIQELYDKSLITEPLPHLVVFGEPSLRLIFPGFVHLISGYAKVGKTELVYAWALEWARANYRVAYYTEESEPIWLERMREHGEDPQTRNLKLKFAQGSPFPEISEDMNTSMDFDLYIFDTTLLLEIEDSNDNTSVAKRLGPIIKFCNLHSITPIFLHHHNKAGGKRGRGITGSYAFLASVDVSLEVYPDKYKENRRNVTGLGRIRLIPDFSYELEGYKVRLIGDTSDVGLQAVRRRVLELLARSGSPLLQKQVEEDLGEPHPSSSQVLNALQSLIKDRLLVATRGSGKGSPLLYSLKV